MPSPLQGFQIENMEQKPTIPLIMVHADLGQGRAWSTDIVSRASYFSPNGSETHHSCLGQNISFLLTYFLLLC